MSNEKDSTNFPLQKGRAPRFRWFTMKLYPENKNHRIFVEETLDLLAVEWYGILHNKDRYAKNKCEIDDKDRVWLKHKKGEIKKAHWHIVVHIGDAKTVNAYRNIVEGYGIEPNLVNSCDRVATTVYLTHRVYKGKDLPDKYVYDDREIIGNFSAYMANLVQQGNGDDFELFDQALSEFMELDNELFTLADAFRFMHQKGLYRVITRTYILTRILETAVKQKQQMYKDLAVTNELEQLYHEKKMKELGIKEYARRLFYGKL